MPRDQIKWLNTMFLIVFVFILIQLLLMWSPQCPRNMFDGQLVRLEAVIIQTNIIRHNRIQHKKQEEDFTFVCLFFSSK